MEISNYSKYYDRTENKAKHAPFFPDNIFCVIAGRTGCGKTNLMLNLLLKENILQYSDVYIYSPTIYQSAYKYLKDYFNKLENKIKTYFKTDVKKSVTFWIMMTKLKILKN